MNNRYLLMWNIFPDFIQGPIVFKYIFTDEYDPEDKHKNSERLVYTCFDLTDAEDIEKLKNINIDAVENNYGVKYLPENIINHCLHIHYNHYEKAIEFLEKEMNKYGYFEFKPSDDMTCIDAVWKTDGHTFAIFYLEQILKILSEEENESV